MTTYEKLLELKKSTRYDYFALACGYFFDIGYNAAKEITDEEIKNVEGNGIMTKDFCEWMMETARTIANTIDSAVELVQFCMAEDIYDIRNYANKLPRYKLEEMIKYRLNSEEIPIDVSPIKKIEFLCNVYDCDEEDLELLGIDIPDEYWEEN